MKAASDLTRVLARLPRTAPTSRSLWSPFSVLSAFSIGSLLSVGSVLSISSAGSILSIGSARVHPEHRQRRHDSRNRRQVDHREA